DSAKHEGNGAGAVSDPTFRPFRNFIPEEPERANAPERLRLSSEFLYPIVLSQEQDLEWFRQLGLRSESEFISWVRKLGISAWSGYQTSDPERLWSRGWIRADEGAIVHRSHRKWQEMAIPVSDIGQALGIPHRPAGRWHRYDLAFHPFRIYPLLKILGLMDWRLTRTSVLYGKGFIDYAGKHVRSFRTLVREPVFNTNLNWWNGIADLAILLAYGVEAFRSPIG
ncbi:MAG: hypothetical protein K8R88_10065, partial [Armatimonadetes bacterium]|nr:hypothetical protein [Armatimonadota bacterium]